MSSFIDRLRGAKSADDDKKEGLSTGAIIGIILLVVVVLIGGYMWYKGISPSDAWSSVKSLGRGGTLASYKPVAWQAMKMPPRLHY